MVTLALFGTISYIDGCLVWYYYLYRWLPCLVLFLTLMVSLFVIISYIDGYHLCKKCYQEG